MHLMFPHWLCFKETVILWNNDLLISLIVQWFFCYRERVLDPIFPQGSIFLLSLWIAFCREKKEKGKALCVSQLWSAWRSCWQLWRESYFWFNQQELYNISPMRMCAPKGSIPLRAAVSHSESAPVVHFELQGIKPLRMSGTGIVQRMAEGPYFTDRVFFPLRPGECAEHIFVS